jgi:hypothetical protein
MVAALSSTSTMAVSEAEMWNGVLQPAKDACGWLTSLAT